MRWVYFWWIQFLLEEVNVEGNGCQILQCQGKWRWLECAEATRAGDDEGAIPNFYLSFHKSLFSWLGFSHRNGSGLKRSEPKCQLQSQGAFVSYRQSFCKLIKNKKITSRLVISIDLFSVSRKYLNMSMILGYFCQKHENKKNKVLKHF